MADVAADKFLFQDLIEDVEELSANLEIQLDENGGQPIPLSKFEHKDRVELIKACRELMKLLDRRNFRQVWEYTAEQPMTGSTAPTSEGVICDKCGHDLHKATRCPGCGAFVGGHA